MYGYRWSSETYNAKTILETGLNLVAEKYNSITLFEPKTHTVIGFVEAKDVPRKKSILKVAAKHMTPFVTREEPSLPAVIPPIMMLPSIFEAVSNGWQIVGTKDFEGIAGMSMTAQQMNTLIVFIGDKMKIANHRRFNFISGPTILFERGGSPMPPINIHNIASLSNSLKTKIVPFIILVGGEDYINMVITIETRHISRVFNYYRSRNQKTPLSFLTFTSNNKILFFEPMFDKNIDSVYQNVLELIPDTKLVNVENDVMTFE